jgi:hypothetical protein
MPPVRWDQLVVGQQYYIRKKMDFEGPWGLGDEPWKAMGLLAFTYDGEFEFHVTAYPDKLFSLLPPLNVWLIFPIEDGVPVAPALPDGGPLVVSDDAKNVITMENIAEGDELVNWNMNGDPKGRRESDFGYYYKMNTYKQLPNPKVSPFTTARINTKNPKRYTASRRVVNTAFPKGSANADLFNRARSTRKRKGKSRKNKRS